MKKPPSFPFYASDFLGSGKVARMTLEHQGAYVRLLCFQWTDGSIPNDLSQLAALCHVPVKQMERIWAAVKPCFKPHPHHPGELINERLEQVREQKEVFLQKQAKNGKMGGRPKGSTKNPATNPDETQTEPKNNPSLNSGLTQTITQKKLSPFPFPVSSFQPSPEELSKHSKSLVREEAESNERTGENGEPGEQKGDPKDPAFLRRLWAPVEQTLREKLAPDTFANYYSGIRIKTLTGNVVIVEVPDALIQRNGGCTETALLLYDHISRHKHDLLRDRSLKVCVREDTIHEPSTT